MLEALPGLRFLAPLLADDHNYNGDTALRGTLFQLLISLLMFICGFLLPVGLGVLLDPLVGENTSRGLGEMYLMFVGMPFLAMCILSISSAYDLIYLSLYKIRLEDGGSEDAKSAKLTAVVGGMALMGLYGFFGMIWGGEALDALRNRIALRPKQQEYQQYLSRGRDAWNAYITRTPMHRIELTGTNLTMRDFTGFYFESVKFDNADLRGTVFDDCNLAMANFEGADCRGTSFKKAYLWFADFKNADLTGAFLEGAAGEKHVLATVKGVSETQLAGLCPRKKSRWAGISWKSFHNPEWLREHGYSQ